jgi:hypothetical protein
MNGERSFQLMKTSVACWDVFSNPKKKSLDCFTNGSNVFGLLKKKTLHSMILNFDKIVFIQVQ